MKWFVLLTVVLPVAIVNADTARFSVVVLDEKEAIPIQDATVRANFSEDIGWRAWSIYYQFATVALNISSHNCSMISSHNDPCTASSDSLASKSAYAENDLSGKSSSGYFLLVKLILTVTVRRLRAACSFAVTDVALTS